MKNRKILVVDREKEFLADMEKVIKRLGHEAQCVLMLSHSLEVAARTEPDIIIVNTEMPDGSGIEALSQLIQIPSTPEIIVISDSGDADQAELAIRSGAWDYIEKPRTRKAMTLPLVRALEYRARKAPSRQSMGLKKETYQEIAGSSPRLKSCLDLVSLASNSEASVLISGETGTGKELFAWAIHNNSKRASNQFVVVDCAALPASLVESTLFGYEKGAFTGADRPHKGLIKRADGGTLFLDEVGELPLSIQKSFLRVLQERRFRAVGGRQEIISDFRLIAATNRDLDDMVIKRQFRKDLLFRLRAFSMELPPLRERPEDIHDIAVRQMEKICGSYGLNRKTFSPDFFSILVRYDWPGNARELVNSLERAISAARDEPVVFPKHLPTYIRVRLARASVSEEGTPKTLCLPDFDSTSPLPSIAEVREAAISSAEQKYLKALIASTKGNIAQAVRISCLSRSRLYALLKKYRIGATGAQRE